MDQLVFFRGSSSIETVMIEEGKQSKALMGDNTVSLSFTLNRPANLQQGDTATIYSEIYTVKDTPVAKRASNLFQYELILYAEGYNLQNVQYLTLDKNNNFTETDFYLHSDSNGFLDLLIQNVRRVYPVGWQLAQVDPTTFATIHFQSDNCYTALKKIAEAFGLEYAVEGKLIYLTQRGANTGYVFRQGIGAGMHSLERQAVQDSSLVTRLYAYGSEKNVATNYGFKRLHLPGGYQPCLIRNLRVSDMGWGFRQSLVTFTFDPPSATGVTELRLEYRITGTSTFTTRGGFDPYSGSIQIVLGWLGYDFRIVTVGATCGVVKTPIFSYSIGFSGAPPVPFFNYAPTPYLENNVSLYGVHEGSVVFDDVYPHRIGTVSAVDPGNPYVFFDSLIDFNVVSYITPGVTPKVTFNKGQLAGYTFDLNNYDDVLKKFIINQNKDEAALEVPSVVIRPAVGDQYVLTDIQMPQKYIIAAEQELLQRATAMLQTISSPQYAYSGDLDPKAIKRKGWTLGIGDFITVQDADLNFSQLSRIVSLTRDLRNEDLYSTTLADAVSRNKIDNLVYSMGNIGTGLQNIQNVVQGGTQANGTWVGNLLVKQGTIIAKDLRQAVSTATLKQLYFDPNSGEFFFG